MSWTMTINNRKRRFVQKCPVLVERANSVQNAFCKYWLSWLTTLKKLQDFANFRKCWFKKQATAPPTYIASIEAAFVAIPPCLKIWGINVKVFSGEIFCKIETHPPGIRGNDLICYERPPPPLLLPLWQGQRELGAKHCRPARNICKN